MTNAGMEAQEQALTTHTHAAYMNSSSVTLCAHCSFTENAFTYAGTALGAKFDGHIHNPVMAHNDTPITK